MKGKTHEEQINGLYNRVSVALGISNPKLESLKPGQTLTITKSLLTHSKKRSWPKVNDLKERLSKLSVKDLYNLSRYEALPWYFHNTFPFFNNVAITYFEKGGTVEWAEQMLKRLNAMQDRMNENNLELATYAYKGSMNHNKEALLMCLVECLTKGPLYVAWRKNITEEFKAYFNGIPPISFGDVITIEQHQHVTFGTKTKTQNTKSLSWNNFVDLFSLYVRIDNNQEHPDRDEYIY